MAKTLFLLCLVFYWSATIAQGDNNRLNGVILYQNSGKKPAIDVEIGVEIGANPDRSSETGQFRLEYSRKKAGENAGLIIGTVDKNGAKIELANPEAVRAISIPRDADKLVVITVCPAGEREKKIKYYEKKLEEYAQGYKKLVEENRKLLQNQNLATAERVKLANAVDSLENLYEQALKDIDERAVIYAGINKDFASDMRLKALEYIEAGDMENANKAIDIEKSRERYDKAMHNKREVKKIEVDANDAIQETIDDYKTKILTEKSLFNYTASETLSRELIGMYYENQYPAYNIAKAYFELAHTLSNKGEYDSALVYYRKTERIYDSIVVTKSEFSALYNNLGHAYFDKGQYDTAIVYYNKELDIRRERSREAKERLRNIAIDCNYLGYAFYFTHQYDSAIIYYKKAFSIDSNAVADSYNNNLGMAYVKSKNFKEAKTYLEKYEAQNIDKGRAKRNWSMYYALYGDKERALDYLKEAVQSGYKDLNWIETDDSLESIRNDDRYKKIVQGLKRNEGTDMGTKPK